MNYNPPVDKEFWTKWLKTEAEILNGKKEDYDDNKIFETPDGDVINAKDLVGNFLALLTNEPVTIN